MINLTEIAEQASKLADEEAERKGQDSEGWLPIRDRHFAALVLEQAATTCETLEHPDQPDKNDAWQWKNGTFWCMQAIRALKPKAD